MKCSKSSSKREVYSDKYLPQETRKVSNNLTVHLKELEKEEQMKPKVSRRKGTNTRAEINEIEDEKTIENISETKSWFFKKICKTDKSLTRLTKKKKEREREGSNKIRNERGAIITNTTEIQKVIRDYYEQSYANKLDKLGEMDKSLEMYNLPKLNHDKIENMNRTITSKEIKSVIKNLPTNKIPEPDGFTGEYYQTFKGE